jgi:hypothetical protein
VIIRLDTATEGMIRQQSSKLGIHQQDASGMVSIDVFDQRNERRAQFLDGDTKANSLASEVESNVDETQTMP